MVGTAESSGERGMAPCGRGDGFGVGGASAGHRDQLGNGDKLESFRFQLIERCRHRFDRSGMNIVRQERSSRLRVSFTMRLRHNARARPFPIERIDVPNDDAITELIVDPALLPRRDRAIGRPHQRRTHSDRRRDGVVGFLQLAPHSFIRHFAEIRMRPGMIADFVTFAHRALQDLRMVRRILSDDEKSRLDVMRGEEIEQFRRELLARSVVESHGDVRPVDVNGVEGDLRFGRSDLESGWGRAFSARPGPFAPEACSVAQMKKQITRE